MKCYFPQIDVACPSFIGSGNWKLSGLTGITVLFGKNGSGKSLFLRALRDAKGEVAHYVVPERTGDLGFEPSFIQQQIDSQQRRNISARNFMPEYRRQILARIQTYFMVRGGGSKPKEIPPAHPDELESLLAQLLPDFAIELQPKNPPYKLIRASDKMEIGPVDQLSSGESQLLTIGIDILTMAAIWEIEGSAERLMLIDEPDAHIHPDLQARFADFLVQTAHRFHFQTIIATHSTTLLAAIGQFGGDASSVVYLDRRSREFTAKQFTAILKEVAACLGGHALMGPLFGMPLLLVEGDDDYRIWSQVPRHHTSSFAVIPSNGEEIYKFQKTLEQIFASLRTSTLTPAGFALLDGDKNLPVSDASNPQSHIKFLRLDCREAENLYFTDEVLSMLGTDWSKATAKIIAESGNHGSKSVKLASAATWDLQNGDLKDVINEVSKILDPKNVHWTMRVGTCIGRNKPVGQLASYLGEGLITALWGN